MGQIPNKLKGQAQRQPLRSGAGVRQDARKDGRQVLFVCFMVKLPDFEQVRTSLHCIISLNSETKIGFSTSTQALSKGAEPTTWDVFGITTE